MKIYLYTNTISPNTFNFSAKTEEYRKLERVRDCCKSLLNHVNTAIKECENQQELLEIAKKVDKGPMERSNNEIVKEFKVCR